MTRAFLVGINQDRSDDDMERSMAELKGLVRACEIEPCYNLVQNIKEINKSTLIGKGKLEEIKRTLENEELDGVIFNESLSPMQQRNLSRELKAEVLDRTGIILEIFSKRARTKEASMQVEYAKLQYILPRLAGMRTELSRQGGTSGSMSNKGLGEKKIELDRRHIEKRMNVLRKNLKEIERERATQRAKRLSKGEFRVSLVGYTNAGKSTIMNTLLDRSGRDSGDKKVFEEDMLFATLDTTVRRISSDITAPFLLSDTVGFIDKLPTSLVSAFHSTLEEVLYADLLLNVVDYSDPHFKEHIEVTVNTLADIGAAGIPLITVYNKVDKSPRADELTDTPGFSANMKEDKIYISAKEGIGINELLKLIADHRRRQEFECDIELPYDRMNIYSYLKENGEILSQKYTEKGIRMKVRCRERDKNILKAYL
ncbi:MAG: GTPase HflX [Lachnospiraceae bacterium]|nr:GTPase HflX [Lachnospiraceae bacterium]